jgi:preprotein translocase subunit SecG
MTGLFTALIIIGCLGMILFVLVQNPKGGGLNSEFGSAVQLGGAKRATDILEKGTWGIAIGIALVCLIMAKDAKQTTGDAEIEADPDAIEQPVTTPPAGGNQPFNGGGAPM